MPKPDPHITELSIAIEKLCDQALLFARVKRKHDQAPTVTLEHAAMEYAETVRVLVEKEKQK